MSEQFGRVYAKCYDVLYGDKNYNDECDLIEKILSQYGRGTDTTILDIGCGTGGHMIPLLKAGYDVVGVDPSRYMIDEAVKKDASLVSRINVGRLQDFKLRGRFEAIICMFSVINYVTETDELIKSLMNVRHHLARGGLFIFDFWYGPAVMTIKPDARIKSVEHNGLVIERIVVPEWDIFSHIIRSHYYLRVIKGDHIEEEVSETHTLRYFFPQEVIWCLGQTGFELVKFSSFTDLDHPPSVNEWDALVVARAV
jgi:SAM-dependent methyltransferase